MVETDKTFIYYIQTKAIILRKCFISYAVRPSAFDIRLAPAIRGLDFIGRVEVNYKNGGWGTVCDYRFDNSDANVICRALNFTRAVCSVYNARTGRGSGNC